MKLPRYIYKYFGIILLLFSFSCASDLDFNQVNDFKSEPVIVANLTYFDVAAPEFVVNGTEVTMAFAALDYDVFRNTFFRDHLKRTDFIFEITNTINRAYIIDIHLIDENDQIVYTIRFNVPPYSGTPNVINKTEIFENAKLTLLKSTKKMGISVAMAPGPPLSKNSVGSLKLRSSANVYLGIE